MTTSFSSRAPRPQARASTKRSQKKSWDRRAWWTRCWSRSSRAATRSSSACRASPRRCSCPHLRKRSSCPSDACSLHLICSPRTSRARTSFKKKRRPMGRCEGASASCPARFSTTWCSRTRSTARRRRRKPRSSKRCKSGASRWAPRPTSCRTHSTCSRREIQSSKRERIRFPRRSWIVFSWKYTSIIHPRSKSVKLRAAPRVTRTTTFRRCSASRTFARCKRSSHAFR